MVGPSVAAGDRCAEGGGRLVTSGDLVGYLRTETLAGREAFDAEEPIVRNVRVEEHER